MLLQLNVNLNFSNNQEWFPWSSWVQAFGNELIYRHRVKYTTSDTYAVQVEWKNKSESDVKIKFEVSDERNIKEVNSIEIPSGSTKILYTGTSFKSRKIKVRLLGIDFLPKPDD